ncbi:hypothetical protein QE152_g30207 [Popillia japonica]|uniref:Uncharacterized protein n=1 Tax=Popillia japonica TaxID=7064 RepID=A0AAW1JF85_POPJA
MTVFIFFIISVTSAVQPPPLSLIRLDGRRILSIKFDRLSKLSRGSKFGKILAGMRSESIQLKVNVIE